MPAALFDPDQHRKILAEWLYPQPTGVEVLFKPFGNDPDKGIGVVFVPIQDEFAKPFLLKRIVGDNNRTSELLVGYVERRVDGTEVRTVADLHHALKVGLNLERELLGRISNIEAMIGQYFSVKVAAETLEVRERALEDRIDRLLNEARGSEMKDQRSLILAAMPTDRSELTTIFSDKPNSIKHRLEMPPSIRPRGGWGLATGDQAKYIRGEFIRVESYRASIDLYRDGTFIFAGAINQNFLAWSNKTNSRLHPLALAEVVVNFTQFYQLVLADLCTAPSGLEFQISVRNLWQDGEKTWLPPGPVTTSPFWEFNALPVREAPDEAWSYKLHVTTASYKPEQVSFQLLRELYIWFGHSDESVPYKKETEDGPATDVDAIASII